MWAYGDKGERFGEYFQQVIYKFSDNNETEKNYFRPANQVSCQYKIINEENPQLTFNNYSIWNTKDRRIVGSMNRNRSQMSHKKIEEVYDFDDDFNVLHSQIMENTNTYISWPHRLKVGAKSKKGNYKLIKLLYGSIQFYANINKILFLLF